MDNEYSYYIIADSGFWVRIPDRLVSKLRISITTSETTINGFDAKKAVARVDLFSEAKNELAQLKRDN